MNEPTEPDTQHVDDFRGGDPATHYMRVCGEKTSALAAANQRIATLEAERDAAIGQARGQMLDYARKIKRLREDNERLAAVLADVEDTPGFFVASALQLPLEIRVRIQAALAEHKEGKL